MMVHSAVYKRTVKRGLGVISLSLLVLLIVFAGALRAEAEDVVFAPRSDGAQVPLMLYGDWSTASCPPTIIVSHGLGGRENGLAYIGTYFSGRGYRVAVMGHKESGLPTLMRVMRTKGKDRSSVLGDPALYKARDLDVQAALAYVSRACRPSFLALAGHSMGAATVLIEAGAKTKVGVRGQNQFDAYVALSWQGVNAVFGEGAWSGIHRPVLLVTGTEDNGASGDYRSRLVAFDSLPSGKKRMAIIPNASHFDIGGRDPAVHAVIVALMDEFFTMIRAGQWRASTSRAADIRDK